MFNKLQERAKGTRRKARKVLKLNHLGFLSILIGR